MPCHQVFSAYGAVQKIAIFEKTAGFQALVQFPGSCPGWFPDVAAATSAKDALEGHCIYEGGYCKLRISFSRHTDLNVKVCGETVRQGGWCGKVGGVARWVVWRGGWCGEVGGVARQHFARV
ncbi:unnamed protein product [Closterium sp. NIES-53]